MACKLTTLEKATQLICDSDVIATSGFGIGSQPVALIHQLMRQGTKNLTLLGVVNGIEADLLAAAGALRRVETSAVSLEEFGLAQNFRRGVQTGAIAVSEYSELGMYNRFLAGSLGLSFWPEQGLEGSDILRVNRALAEVACPFTGEKYTALPAARPRWVLVHAPFADENGNVYHPYRTSFTDMAAVVLRAADRAIVSAEQIIDYEWAVSHSAISLLAGFKVEAVTQAPLGAHPCGFGTLYNPDLDYLRKYVAASRNEADFRRYLENYVYGVKDHMGYLERAGSVGHLMGLRTAIVGG